ncbi:MAG: LysM peptidoglycan-binding domain-containing protein [Verrucomicrobiae bacterium]|nr:LysM peptidoglycan-binding domain-containing protein [Verrucomicrobiae bacterium]
MSREITVPLFFSGALMVALSTTGCGMFNRAPDPIAPVPTAVQEPASAEAPAATNTPAPEPFSLKEGEQLLPYKVQKGDSLWELAQKYNTRVSRIKAANNLQSDMIVEGRTLQIPTKGAAPAAPAAATPAPAPMTTPQTAPTPAPTLVPAPTPAPAPAPAAPAPSQPSLNFGTPAPAGGGSAPAGNGLKIQD